MKGARGGASRGPSTPETSRGWRCGLRISGHGFHSVSCTNTQDFLPDENTHGLPAVQLRCSQRYWVLPSLETKQGVCPGLGEPHGEAEPGRRDCTGWSVSGHRRVLPPGPVPSTDMLKCASLYTFLFFFLMAQRHVRSSFPDQR